MHFFKKCVGGILTIITISYLYIFYAEYLYLIMTVTDSREIRYEYQNTESWVKNWEHFGHTYNKRVKKFLNSTEKDILNMEPPTFLPNLNNPCWYEDNGIGQEQNLHCLPYFMLIGQPKSGTSDLYKSIISHPDVEDAKTKEPQYWARHRHCYCCGRKTYWFMCKHDKPWSWSQYINSFKRTAYRINNLLKSHNNDSRYIVTGDGSVSTLWDNRWWWNYPQNVKDEEPPPLLNAHYIRHFLPKVKLIILLRNPVDRLYSEYIFFTRGTKSPTLFHQEVQNQIKSFHECSRNHNIRFCLYHNSYDEHKTNTTVRLFNGFYAIYIQDWFEVFPREQFLILRLEEYSQHKEETMKKTFRFLGLREADIDGKATRYNKRGKKGREIGDMLNSTRLILNTFYRPYTQKLAELLKDRRFLWQD